METHEDQDWRTTNVSWQNICILALGVAVALVLAVRSADAAQDGVGSLFGGLFSAPIEDRSNLVASPQLVEVLEAAPDGTVKQITVEITGASKQVVTYLVEPKSSFTVGERNCRTFTVNASTESMVREAFRIACRQDGGNWRVASSPSVSENQLAN